MRIEERMVVRGMSSAVANGTSGGWSRSHLSTGKMSKGVHKYCLSVGEGEVTNSETENHSAWEIVMPTDRIR